MLQWDTAQLLNSVVVSINKIFAEEENKKLGWFRLVPTHLSAVAELASALVWGKFGE